VTAADLQLAERHGGDCEDVESFAELPISATNSKLLNGNPALSGTADTLEGIACQLGILLADEQSSSEYTAVGYCSHVYEPRCALPGTEPACDPLSMILINNHKTKSFRIVE
jgi:hypothetical protein